MPSIDQDFVVQTDRLLLKKIVLKDAAFMLKLLNSPGWLQFIGDRNVRTVKEAKSYLKNGILKSYQENCFGFYKVVSKANQEALGICGLIKREQLEAADLGFALLPEFSGKGYGFEASMAVLTLARVQFKLDKLAAIVQHDNIVSRQLLQKLGFIYEKDINPFAEKEDLMYFVKDLV